MKNKRNRFYPIISRIQAKSLAKQLNEKNWKQFLEIVSNVPRPLIRMALRETERANSIAIIPRSKTDSFISRLKFYAKTFGIRYPEK